MGVAHFEVSPAHFEVLPAPTSPEVIMSRQRSRRWTGALGIAVTLAAPSLAAVTTFYWNAGGENCLWSNCENWAIIGLDPSTCYPRLTRQNAMIPSGAGPFTIQLDSVYAIGDFVVQDDSTFTGPCPTSTALNVERLEIQAGATGTLLTVSSCNTVIQVSF